MNVVMLAVMRYLALVEWDGFNDAGNDVAEMRNVFRYQQLGLFLRRRLFDTWQLLALSTGRI